MNIDKDVDFEYLVKKTEYYSGADITILCREASMMPMRKHLKNMKLEDISGIKGISDEPISMSYFKKSLGNVKSSINKTTLDKYHKWMTEFGNC